MSKVEMKKIYEKPSVEVMEYYAEQPILSASIIYDEFDPNGEEVEDPL